MKRFLEQNPSGQYHDRAVALLDDLAWREATRKGDAANLKGYLGSYPSGRHREEATAQLARLTPPPVAAPAPQAQPTAAPIPPAPPVTPKLADNAEDVNAIRGVLDGYKSAYDTKDVAKLQELWPDMSPKQVNVLRTGVPRCRQSHVDVLHHQGAGSSRERGRGQLSTANRHQCGSKSASDDDLEKGRNLLAHHFCPLSSGSEHVGNADQR